MEASIKVRLVTEKDDDLKNYIAKRHPRIFDFANCLLACDPTGVYVGELDGKPMCTLAVLKYDPSYCHICCYWVEEGYRGKGYGMQLWKTATRTISRSHNMSLFSGDNMVHKYEEQSGFDFKGLWNTHYYQIDLQTAARQFSKCCDKGFEAQTIDQVDMQELYKYDTSVFGYQRQTFLQTYLLSEGSHARVVINSEGIMVGFAAAIVMSIKEKGYRVGPVYADSLEIAQVLLKALFDEILENGISPSTSAWVDIPVGRNVEAKKLIDLLNGQIVWNMTYMTTKGIPRGDFEKCFAITSAQLG